MVNSLSRTPCQIDEGLCDSGIGLLLEAADLGNPESRECHSTPLCDMDHTRRHQKWASMGVIARIYMTEVLMLFA